MLCLQSFNLPHSLAVWCFTIIPVLIRLKRDDSITLLACPPNILEQLVHHDLVKPKTRRAVMVNYASVFEILAM